MGCGTSSPTCRRKVGGDATPSDDRQRPGSALPLSTHSASDVARVVPPLVGQRFRSIASAEPQVPRPPLSPLSRSPQQLPLHIRRQRGRGGSEPSPPSDVEDLSITSLVPSQDELPEVLPPPSAQSKLEGQQRNSFSFDRGALSTSGSILVTSTRYSPTNSTIRSPKTAAPDQRSCAFQQSQLLTLSAGSTGDISSHNSANLQGLSLFSNPMLPAKPDGSLEPTSDIVLGDISLHSGNNLPTAPPAAPVTSTATSLPRRTSFTVLSGSPNLQVNTGDASPHSSAESPLTSPHRLRTGSTPQLPGLVSDSFEHPVESPRSASWGRSQSQQSLGQKSVSFVEPHSHSHDAPHSENIAIPLRQFQPASPMRTNSGTISPRRSTLPMSASRTAKPDNTTVDGNI